jgi:hypothetical protein
LNVFTKFRSILAASSLGLLLAIPPAMAADRSASAAVAVDCWLRDFTVTAVKPYYEAAHIKTPLRRLKGAEIYVAAQPGLTIEWLRAEVTRHLVNMKAGSMAQCSFDGDGVQVTVASAGGGFRVVVRTDHDGQASEILRRAQSLLPSR